LAVKIFCQEKGLSTDSVPYTALGKSGPGRAAVAQFIGFRFSAAGGSGFGCREKEVLDPDT